MIRGRVYNEKITIGVFYNKIKWSYERVRFCFAWAHYEHQCFTKYFVSVIDFFFTFITTIVPIFKKLRWISYYLKYKIHVYGVFYCCIKLQISIGMKNGYYVSSFVFHKLGQIKPLKEHIFYIPNQLYKLDRLCIPERNLKI